MTSKHFKKGESYTRKGIGEIYFPGVGRPKGGPWDTGYVRPKGTNDLVVFMTIGMPGRSSLNFNNHYDESNQTIVWFGKPGSHSEQPTFKKLLNGELAPHFFARWDTKPQFTYLGEGAIIDYKDGVPCEDGKGNPKETIELQVDCGAHEETIMETSEAHLSDPILERLFATPVPLRQHKRLPFQVKRKNLPSYIYQSLLNLGGHSRLAFIYKEVERLRILDGHAIPKTFEFGVSGRLQECSKECSGYVGRQDIFSKEHYIEQATSNEVLWGIKMEDFGRPSTRQDISRHLISCGGVDSFFNISQAVGADKRIKHILSSYFVKVFDERYKDLDLWGLTNPFGWEKRNSKLSGNRQKVMMTRPIIEWEPDAMLLSAKKTKRIAKEASRYSDSIKKGLEATEKSNHFFESIKKSKKIKANQKEWDRLIVSQQDIFDVDTLSNKGMVVPGIKTKRQIGENLSRLKKSEKIFHLGNGVYVTINVSLKNYNLHHKGFFGNGFARIKSKLKNLNRRNS